MRGAEAVTRSCSVGRQRIETQQVACRLLELVRLLETRLVERIAGVETRLTAQITNLTWRLLGLLTAVAAVAMAFVKYL